MTDIYHINMVLLVIATVNDRSGVSCVTNISLLQAN